MASSAHAGTLRRAPSTRALVAVGAICFLLLIGGRLSGIGDVARAQTFAIIFTAIVVEALPFMLLGAFASGIVEVYVSDATFRRIAGLPAALQLPVAALGGFAFPVCECGSVPVARRLIKRGMHPSAGVAFMLASPIFNPIVLASTWVAYSPRGLAFEMVAGRAGLGLIVALAAGWTLGADGARQVIGNRQEAPVCHDDSSGPPVTSRRRALAEHVAADFFSLGKFLVAGAALAAAIQTVVPQSVVAGFARTPVIGALTLMIVAFVSSLCSEADAFVAVSFTQFPLSSQLAFLVSGPVLDFKLAFLYGGAFRKRFVPALAAVVLPVVLGGALWFEVLMR